MDYTTVFKNSGRLIWRHKLLLVFGLLLISGSIPTIMSSHFFSQFSLSSMFGFSSDGNPTSFVEPIAEFFINPNLPLVLGGTIGVFFLFIGIWLLTTIGEVSLIRGVADFDDDQPRSLGDLFSVGIKLLARIIAIDTVIFLPLFLILLVQLLTIGGGMIAAIQFIARPGNAPDDLLPIGVIVGLVLLFLTLLSIPVTILTFMLRLIAFRSAVLEDLPTRPSIRRGWTLIRAKLGEIIIVALLLYAVSYAVGMITSLLVLPFSLGGVFTMFQSFTFTPGQLPQVPNFDGFITLITIASIIGIFPNLIYRVFSSAVWTLSYREWQKES